MELINRRLILKIKRSIEDFFTRIFIHPDSITKNKNGFSFPNLTIGRDAKFRESYLPTINKTRQNHVIFTDKQTDIDERIFKKYIDQDIRLQQAFNSNKSLLATQNDWNDDVDSLQPYFVNGLAVVEPDGKLSKSIKRDAIDYGVAQRDIHYFDPSSKQSGRIELMNLNVDIITTFLNDVVTEKSEDDIPHKKEWIRRLVHLSKTSSRLTHQLPSIQNLLELFRNPSAIMDSYRYIGNNFDSIENNDDIKDLVDDLKENFRLGDIKQNEINFAIYSVLNKYFESSTLGKYLIDTNRKLVSFHSIMHDGGVYIFNLCKDHLGKESKVWANLVSYMLLNASINKHPLSSPQFPIYLSKFDEYLTDTWLALFLMSAEYQMPITMQLSSLFDSSLKLDFPVRSIYVGNRINENKELERYIPYLAVSSEQTAHILLQMPKLNGNTLLTTFDSKINLLTV